MSQIEKEFLAEECGVDESEVFNSFPIQSSLTFMEWILCIYEIDDDDTLNIRQLKTYYEEYCKSGYYNDEKG